MIKADGIRVLVCGGRQFTDAEHLAQALDAIRQRRGPFAVFIHGPARGADILAGEWATARDIPVQEFPAQWEAFKNRRSAGPIRNQQMLAEGKPDLVIAFPGARGTAHIVRLAREAGVEVIEEPGRQPGQVLNARAATVMPFSGCITLSSGVGPLRSPGN